MSGKTIAISHLSPQLEDYYALSTLAKIWQRNGYAVSVRPEYARDACLCILHHDRTKLDAATLPASPPGIRVLNDQILDISKRKYSTLAVRRDDDWRGRVIVKTNLNHFGLPERNAHRMDIIARARRRIARHSWRVARMLPERSYPILDSQCDVPDWVWSSSDFLVERFMPEQTHDGLYCVRGWLFLGDQGYGYRLFATDPLVKVQSMVRYEYLERVPPELVALRTALGFDFGKFDYVEHNGRPILLDANKTPTLSGEGESPNLQRLARGIEAFL